MAKNLLSSGLVDVIELSQNVSMVEINVKKEWVNKNLIELNFRKKYSINVIAIKENNNININVDPTLPLNDKMTLIVVGNISKLTKIK